MVCSRCLLLTRSKPTDMIHTSWIHLATIKHSRLGLYRYHFFLPVEILGFFTFLQQKQKYGLENLKSLVSPAFIRILLKSNTRRLGKREMT